MYNITCKNMHLVHIFNIYRVNIELGFSFTCLIDNSFFGKCHFSSFVQIIC